MLLTTPAGISYEKPDGACAHPHCEKRIDWKENDKPPPEWATVILFRMPAKKKTGTARTLAAGKRTFLLCPQHTIGCTVRQPGLFARTANLIRTVIESPFAGDVAKNLRYLRAAMADCFSRLEAPYASHGLYTQDGVLDDKIPEQRRLGIKSGFLWGEAAEKIIVYTDLGISDGMKTGIALAEERGQPVEYRSLDGWAQGKLDHE